MLNIGLLAPGAGEYYIGEVASSAEDYYTGRGESAGRWVGSLAAEIGLSGEVAPEDFRLVLAGRDPRSECRVATSVASSKAGNATYDRSPRIRTPRWRLRRSTWSANALGPPPVERHQHLGLSRGR